MTLLPPSYNLMLELGLSLPHHGSQTAPTRAAGIAEPAVIGPPSRRTPDEITCVWGVLEI